MYDTIHPFSPSFSFLSKHLRVHFLSKKRDESWSFNWFPFLVMSCCWHNNGILSLFPFTLNQSTLEPDEDFGRKRLKLKWKFRSFSRFFSLTSFERQTEWRGCSFCGSSAMIFFFLCSLILTDWLLSSSSSHFSPFLCDVRCLWTLHSCQLYILSYSVSSTLRWRSFFSISLPKERILSLSFHVFLLMSVNVSPGISSWVRVLYPRMTLFDPVTQTTASWKKIMTNGSVVGQSGSKWERSKLLVRITV